MASSTRQPDLFEQPSQPASPSGRTLRTPYSLAELTELDRQLRQFERVPDEWCAGWVEMMERAYDTVDQVPSNQRAAYRAVFFDEAERLYRVDAEETRQALERQRRQESGSRRARRTATA